MKRVLLITLVLGSVLVIAPAANAVVLSSDSGGSGSLRATVQPVPVTDGWMASVTPSYTFHADVLGGAGGTSVTNGPIVTGDDSFAWNLTAIGAASLAGAMLLALGTLAVTRRKHILSF